MNVDLRYAPLPLSSDLSVEALVSVRVHILHFQICRNLTLIKFCVLGDKDPVVLLYLCIAGLLYCCCYTVCITDVLYMCTFIPLDYWTLLQLHRCTFGLRYCSFFALLYLCTVGLLYSCTVCTSVFCLLMHCSTYIHTAGQLYWCTVVILVWDCCTVELLWHCTVELLQPDTWPTELAVRACFWNCNMLVAAKNLHMYISTVALQLKYTRRYGQKILINIWNLTDISVIL